MSGVSPLSPLAAKVTVTHVSGSVGERKFEQFGRPAKEQWTNQSHLIVKMDELSEPEGTGQVDT